MSQYLKPILLITERTEPLIGNYLLQIFFYLRDKKKLFRLHRNASRGAYRGMSTSFAKLFPELWEEEQAQEMFLDAVEKEVAGNKSYFKFYTTYAQKSY